MQTRRTAWSVCGPGRGQGEEEGGREGEGWRFVVSTLLQVS